MLCIHCSDCMSIGPSDGDISHYMICLVAVVVPESMEVELSLLQLLHKTTKFKLNYKIQVQSFRAKFYYFTYLERNRMEFHVWHRRHTRADTIHSFGHGCYVCNPIFKRRILFFSPIRLSKQTYCLHNMNCIDMSHCDYCIDDDSATTQYAAFASYSDGSLLSLSLAQ